MKIKQFSLLTFIVLVMNACGGNHREDLTLFVNPFIGTGGDGHTYPGASMPFGMVQLSPDTRLEGQESCGGYYYTDGTILGFSHTHLNGVGEPEYRDVLFMPMTGKAFLTPGPVNRTSAGYRSRYRHSTEIAGAGYYSVMLNDYGIKAELTATLRAGMHRYTFPASENSHILIDLAHPGGAEELFIRKINNTDIEGLRRSHGWAYDQYVYFYARFSKPFVSFDIASDDIILEGKEEAQGKNIKALVHYKTEKNEQILVKVGISAVSMEGARKNLEAEIPGWDFDEVALNAKKSWNEVLNKITIEGGSPEQRQIFYTAMYHAFLSPDVFMDVDGKYRGIDHKVHTADGFTNYTVFSMWDTFRALHPLFTIVERERTVDFIKSLLQKYDDGGRLPMWPLAGNYTDDMLGYHAAPIIVDAWAKGIRNFDTEKAFKAMKEIAGMDRLGLKYYKKIGYLPYDRQGESVSKTLEYCYDDWCISRMAKGLARQNDYLQFHQRAHFYENVFDKNTGFMRGKSYDRKWLEPFDPMVNSAYSEGNAYQYMFVPHDIDGLIDLMGGDRAFSHWLDVLFSLKSAVRQPGNIGQYWHGNEPSHHLAYMYDYAGEPWKTQKLVRRILDELYNEGPSGLAGNEDCGQMSAWYIMSALGFYPVTPGLDIYAIGSPLFDRATIHLENGNKFIVQANNNSPQNVYIQSATLNGVPYFKSYISHEEIMNSGEMIFEMGPEPNKTWGAKENERPYTDNGDKVTRIPFVSSASQLFNEKITILLGCDTRGAEIRYTIDGTDPTQQSALFTTPITIDKSTTLKMRAYHNELKPSAVIAIPFEKAVPLPAMDKNVRPGLGFKYYERFFVTTADLDNAVPVESGTINTFTVSKADKPTYFGYMFDGYIKVPADGIYTFYLLSNDGSRLFIDDREIIENDANHSAVEEPGQIALKAGLHKIRVKYFQCGGRKELKVSWQGPGFKKKEISPAVLFSDY